MPLDYKVNDIVSAYGQEFIITRIKPNCPVNPYVAVKPNGQGAEYKLAARAISRKVGEANAEHPALQAKERRERERTEPSDTLAHNAFCRMMALRESSKAALWERLGVTKIGDQIAMYNFRGEAEEVTLLSVLRQGQRYNFTARRKTGGAYKYNIAVLRPPVQVQA